MNLTHLNHSLLSEYVKERDRVIDATCGNGHDTLALAKWVGCDGYVIAIDKQDEAVFKTKERLEQHQINQKSICVLKGSHEKLLKNEKNILKYSYQAIVFNLGYLPGGDHNITTMADQTLSALEAAIMLLKERGILSVMCYPGHSEGEIESKAVLNWVKQQANKGLLDYKEYHPETNKKKPPFLLWIEKK